MFISDLGTSCMCLQAVYFILYMLLLLCKGNNTTTDKVKSRSAQHRWLVVEDCWQLATLYIYLFFYLLYFYLSISLSIYLYINIYIKLPIMFKYLFSYVYIYIYLLNIGLEHLLIVYLIKFIAGHCDSCWTFYCVYRYLSI